MKPFKLYYISIICCTILAMHSSCVLWQSDPSWENSTLQTVNIDVLEPAETDLPKNIRNILIIPPRADSVRYSLRATIHDGSDVVLLKQYIDDIVEGSYNSLTSLISDSPRFDKILLYNQEIDSLNNDDIVAFCDSNNTEGILYLSGMKATLGLSPLYLYEQSYDYNLTEYYFEVSIVIKTVWTLYRPDDVPINIPVTNTQKLTRFTTKDSFGQIYESSDMQNIIDNIKFMPGESCAKKIAPTWDQTSRYVFTRGNSDLRKAYKYCESGDFDSAMVIWKNNSENQKPIVAKHAQYNMIFGYEMRGELDSALEKARSFCRQYNLDAAINYQNTLEERIKSDQRVRGQLQ